MRSVLCLAALAAGIIGVSAAQASGGGSSETLNGTIRGMLHHKHKTATTTPAGAGRLVYHGGPVMNTNTTYAIYWQPAGSTMQSGYSTLIDQFFTDVAADSGLTTNVYYAATQYSDGGGNVQYQSTFGGSYTDTTPLPASKCTDSYTSICLTDQQLRAELQKDIAANGWPTGPSVEFFLFTAKGVGSCTGSSCAFGNFCGYHSWIGTGSTQILYANMPYADTTKSRCDGGQHPNANAADATISVVSHEHNETITDPRSNAWYDAQNDENGDKCAWIYGPLSGTTAGAKWNQTINGHHYFLQEEWSNLDAGCVQSGL
jgi:hypothetical protein